MPPAPGAPAPADAAAALAQLRERTVRLLADILGMMGCPASLDVKDTEAGGLSVALHFEGAPPPGVEVGKRSQVMDALQFLLNKMLQRPGQERRHVALGCGAHPEPRPAQPPRAAQAPAAAPAPAPARTPAAPAAAAAAKPAAPQKGAAPAQKPAPAAAAAPARPREQDERTLEVAEDAALQAAARLLAQKSSGLGRFYALAAMYPEDRARVLKGVEGVAGVRVACEGEGRNRRVVFTPEKPAPLPRRSSALPVDDDEDLED
ncbi:hypothetical protein IR215_23800 [Simulacricoccus sp. 17bor-14]|nr:hypothetical protein [Simulacricoccus sp. 17bor-14]